MNKQKAEYYKNYRICKTWQGFWIGVYSHNGVLNAGIIEFGFTKAQLKAKIRGGAE